MKISEIRALIKEEVRKVLKEAEVTTLSALKVGDQFTLAGDGVVSTYTGGYYKVSASKYKNIVFTVLEITAKSIICTDGEFKGNSLTSPVDLTRKLPTSVYTKTMTATSKLNAIKGTYDDVARGAGPMDSRGAIVFKAQKADSQVNKVKHLN